MVRRGNRQNADEETAIIKKGQNDGAANRNNPTFLKKKRGRARRSAPCRPCMSLDRKPLQRQRHEAHVASGIATSSSGCSFSAVLLAKLGGPRRLRTSAFWRLPLKFGHLDDHVAGFEPRSVAGPLRVDLVITMPFMSAPILYS